MRIVITGGPSSEPIDGVRFITNQSSGELAVLIAQKFQEAGNEVELLLGRRSIFRSSSARFFDTNEDLERLLGEIVNRERVQAVLHAAALADFEVANLVVEGQKQGVAKISSAATAIQLRLVPKAKVIARLRELFPEAWIIGWKFELDGSPADVVGKGIQQIETYATNACVVNGSAFGPGFGYCNSTGLVRSVRNKEELAGLLLQVIQEAGAGSPSRPGR
jgi:phosphopantothenoylcysteine decarboxylase/phosphopantothenate--cysteine ligase